MIQVMRNFIFMLFLVSPVTLTQTLGEPRYAIGDCITPINEDWSWYNEYAVVDDYGTSMKFNNAPTYRLVFPNRTAATGPFNAKQLDAVTMKVSWEYCFYQKPKDDN